VLQLQQKEQNTENQSRQISPIKNGVVQANDSLVKHTVLEHETLYSISKRYMVAVDDLMQLNQLQERSIQPGETILIPLKKKTLPELKVREVPNISQLDFSNKLFDKKNNFNVWVLLPMNFDKNSAALNGVTENAKLNAYTKISLQFYMGIKMAFDSLEKQGLNAYIQLIDTKLDSTILFQKLNTFKNKPDLIIGPLMPKLLSATAIWCFNNKIPLLSLAAAPSTLLKGNPYFFSSVPSDMRLIEGMADDLALHHASDNLILINSGLSADKKEYDLFKTQFEKKLLDSGKHASLKEVNYKANFSTYINDNANNIFILPSQNRVIISSFMTALNKIRNSKKDDVQINVYGLKEWENYDELKLNYKVKLNLHYPSSIDLNYADSINFEFVLRFRNSYQSDPDKFAFQGFDVVHFFVGKYMMQLPISTKGIINNFNYMQRSAESGQENSNVFILRYTGFEIKKESSVYE
jgi:LysM repeat protein